MSDRLLENKYALVTGASSGIGREFAKQLAEKGCNLIIVARREDRLIQIRDTFKEKYEITVISISMDLSLSDAPQQLYEAIKSKKVQVDILINNAGTGVFGEFIKTPLEGDIKMLNLDIINLVAITKLFIKDMVKRKHGYVLNVASVGAYQPMAAYATYCAAKSFVLSFTEALSYELKNTQVSVTALSPGDTETEFFENAGQSELSETHKKGMMNSQYVVKVGIEAMLSGKSNIIPGLMNKISAILFRMLPHKITIPMIDTIYMKGKR